MKVNNLDQVVVRCSSTDQEVVTREQQQEVDLEAPKPTNQDAVMSAALDRLDSVSRRYNLSLFCFWPIFVLSPTSKLIGKESSSASLWLPFLLKIAFCWLPLVMAYFADRSLGRRKTVIGGSILTSLLLFVHPHVSTSFGLCIVEVLAAASAFGLFAVEAVYQIEVMPPKGPMLAASGLIGFLVGVYPACYLGKQLEDALLSSNDAFYAALEWNSCTANSEYFFGALLVANAIRVWSLVESPRYLLAKGQRQEAYDALVQMNCGVVPPGFTVESLNCDNENTTCGNNNDSCDSSGYNKALSVSVGFLMVYGAAEMAVRSPTVYWELGQPSFVSIIACLILVAAIWLGLFTASTESETGEVSAAAWLFDRFIIIGLYSCALTVCAAVMVFHAGYTSVGAQRGVTTLLITTLAAAGALLGILVFRLVASSCSSRRAKAVGFGLTVAMFVWGIEEVVYYLCWRGALQSISDDLIGVSAFRVTASQSISDDLIGVSAFRVTASVLVCYVLHRWWPKGSFWVH